MILTLSTHALIERLSDGCFHSGAQLGQYFGITRSAVWKSIKHLVALGIEVERIHGKGYRIPNGIELFCANKIQSVISPAALSYLNHLEILDSIDSTNRYLLDQTKELPSLKSGKVCLAEHQTAGRGRNHKLWVSPFGKNIYLSILWSFYEGPSALSGLTLAVGVALMKALNYYGATGVGLKWPNDVYYGHQKLAGVLTEMVVDSVGVCHAVIGIGLNVDMSTQGGLLIDKPWIDLKTILQTPPARNRLTGFIINEMLLMLPDFALHGFANYYEKWQQADILRGREVAIQTPNGAFVGIAEGIDLGGALQLRQQGIVQKFHAGEASIRSL